VLVATKPLFRDRDEEEVRGYRDALAWVHEQFSAITVVETAAAMALLIDTWNRCVREKWAPPAVALAAFNLDFLCIHPFRDGNGRVSRLAPLLQTYQAGMEGADRC